MVKNISDFAKGNKEPGTWHFKRSVSCLIISISLSVITFILAWNGSHLINDIYGILGIVCNLIACLFSGIGTSNGILSYLKKEQVLIEREIVFFTNLALLILQGLLGYANLT